MVINSLPDEKRLGGKFITRLDRLWSELLWGSVKRV